MDLVFPYPTDLQFGSALSLLPGVISGTTPKWLGANAAFCIEGYAISKVLPAGQALTPAHAVKLEQDIRRAPSLNPQQMMAMLQGQASAINWLAILKAIGQFLVIELAGVGA